MKTRSLFARARLGAHALLLALLAATVQAAPQAAPAAADPAADKPFAEARVALQISEGDSARQTLVLNVANNLLKHYGPDKVDVEVVAFGPGLRLLFANNVNAPRIAALATNGVRFAACSNTIAAMTRKLGHPPQLNPVATPVPAGVVRLVELSHAGYTTVKP